MHITVSFNQASEGVLTGKCSKRERSKKKSHSSVMKHCSLVRWLIMPAAVQQRLLAAICGTEVGIGYA